MTEFGIRVKRSTGQGQIDHNYQNLRFLEYGTESVPSRDTNYSVSTNFIGYLRPRPAPYYYEKPFIATKADSTYYHGFWYGIYNSGATDSFRIFCEGAFTLYYAGWGTPKDDIGLGGAITIRTPKGEVAFNSSKRWMQIVGAVQDSLSTSDSYNDHTVQDADNNYFFLTNPAIARDGGVALPTSDHYARGFKRTSSTNIRVAPFKMADVQAGDDTYDYWVDYYQLIEIKPN